MSQVKRPIVVKYRPCATCKYNMTCGGSGSNTQARPCKGWAKKG